MKKVFTLLLATICITGYAQLSITDSLNNVYKHSATDSARCYNLILLAKEYVRTNPDTSQKMAEAALSQAIALKSDFLIIHAYVTIGTNLSQKNDYPGSAKYFYDALKLSEKLRNVDCIATSKNELAVLEKKKGNYEKTLSLLKEILLLPQEELRDWTRFKLYQNVGLCFATLNKPDSALLYYQKAEPFGSRINNPFARAMLINNIAIVYLRTGAYEKAISNYNEVISIGESIGSDELLFLGNCNIGDTYFEQNKYPEAIPYYSKSIPYAIKAGNYEYQSYVYGCLVQTYEKTGAKDEALRFFHLLDGVKDTAYLKLNDKTVAEMETKYQTEKKEAQIRLQELELNKKKGEIFRQRTWLFGLIAGLLAFTIVGYLFYNRYRLRQKQILNEALIREQQLGLNAVIEAQETERKRIAKDLHDGIAQELVAMKLGFEQFREKENSEKFNSLLKAMDDACTEVRNISHVMSPPMLGNKGLPGSLEMLLRNSLEPAGIRHQFENLGVTDKADEKTEIGIYRIAQELINNIIKHSKAGHVIIQLQKTGSQMILRVEDDGEGFDFETAKHKGSMGLLNILSRVRTLNGTFVSEPSSPKGTVSLVRIPV